MRPLFAGTDTAHLPFANEVVALLTFGSKVTVVSGTFRLYGVPPAVKVMVWCVTQTVAGPPFVPKFPATRAELFAYDLLVLGDVPATALDVEQQGFVREFVAEGGGRWNVYAGGYSDMVAQRGVGVAERTVAKQVKTPREKVDAPAPPQRQARLSFKDKHALERLPAQIATLEAEIAKLTKTIADPELYARDRAAFDNASAALASAQAELATAEDEWLRLETLREQVEVR